jgi:hypothetical protein
LNKLQSIQLKKKFFTKSRKDFSFFSRDYASTLVQYLTDFIHRSKPLIDLNAEFDKVAAEFEVKWKAGQFIGWPKDLPSAQSSSQIDLWKFSTVEDLIRETDLTRLKNALKALGESEEDSFFVSHLCKF